MQIGTKDGWKELPRECEKPGHVPSLMEQMGITPEYDGVAAFAAYANSAGRGVYFTYLPDGSAYQSRPAINPLMGMKGEDEFEVNLI